MLSFLFYGIGGVVVLFAASKLFRSSALGRIGEAGMAQADKAGWAIWKKDPVAVLQRRINGEAEKIKFNKEKIKKFKGYLNQNKRNYDEQSSQLQQAQARVEFWVSKGDDANAEKAAAEADRIERTFGVFKKTYESMAKQYQQALTSLTTSENFIVEAKQRATQLGATLDMSRVNAQMREMASSLGVGAEGDVRQGLDEAFREVELQVDTANASVEVEDDLSELRGGSTADEKTAYEAAQRSAGASARVAAAKAKLALRGPSAQGQLPG